MEVADLPEAAPAEAPNNRFAERDIGLASDGPGRLEGMAHGRKRANKPNLFSQARAVASVSILAIIALLWRLPHAARLPSTHIDEVRFAAETVRRMQQGEWLFFISGTNYGAPVHEAVSVLFIRLFGEAVFVHRLSTVLFGVLAVLVSYIALRRVISKKEAFALALLLACPLSTVGHYSIVAHPAYMCLACLIALVQIATIGLERSPSAWRWIGFAALNGVAFYVIKLSLFQTAVSVLWLFGRSETLRRIVARLRSDACAQREAKQIAGFCTAAALLCIPVGYHYLTRRETFHISWIESGLSAGAGLLLLGSAVRLFAWVRIPAGTLLLAIACAAVFAAIQLPSMLWFQWSEAPRIEAAGQKMWTEMHYSLKHAHEWPFQARLFLDRVFPAMTIGRWSELDGYPAESVSLTWKSFVSAAMLGTFGYLAWKRRASILAALASGNPVLLIGLPPLLVFLVMFPSWSLHSDTCFRYFVPYFSGLLLLAHLLFRPLFQGRPRVFGACVGGYIVYCLADCWIFLN